MHIKFKGDGSAEIIGIPARDLSIEDWDGLSKDQQAHALASGLYESVKPVQVPVVNQKKSPDSGKEAN